MSYVSGFMIGASIGKSIHQFFSGCGTARPVRTVCPAVPASPQRTLPLFSRTAACPGRRRYYAASLRSNTALAQLLAQSLYKLSGLSHIEVNPRTGSLLLLGDEKTLNTVERVLREQVFAAKLPCEELMEELDEAEKIEERVESDFRHTAADVGSFFNRTVSQGTNNLLDMRGLLSLLFIVRGLRKILLYDQRASGPQMLWWAFNLLRGK